MGVRCPNGVGVKIEVYICSMIVALAAANGMEGRRDIVHELREAQPEVYPFRGRFPNMQPTPMIQQMICELSKNICDSASLLDCSYDEMRMRSAIGKEMPAAFRNMSAGAKASSSQDKQLRPFEFEMKQLPLPPL